MRLIRIATTQGFDTFVNPNQIVSVRSIEGTKRITRICSVDNEWIDSFENIDTICARLTMENYETKEK